MASASVPSETETAQTRVVPFRPILRESQDHIHVPVQALNILVQRILETLETLPCTETTEKRYNCLTRTGTERQCHEGKWGK